MVQRADISGLVLAGGRGQRFNGRDKGWIAFDGRALIEHACERLRPQVGQLLISANRNVERYAEFAPVVRDDTRPETYAGPLAGIAAALRVVRTGWLAVVPCDAPAFPLDLVERLAAGVGAGRGDTRAACALADGRMQPLFALLHASLHADIEAALARGERRATDCLQAIGAVAVAFDDAAAFANLNTPADLERRPLAVGARGEPAWPPPR